MGAGTPIVAFVGAGRDGSTMLQRLVDGAPGLWMYPVEIKFANRFDAAVEAAGPPPALAGLDRAARRLGLRPGVTIAAPGAVAPGGLLEAWTRDQFRNVDEHYLPALVEPLGAATPPAPCFDPDRGYRLAEGLRTFLAAARETYGGPAEAATAFKTIEVEHERRYAAALPDSRFVHIVRDPLTQFASTKRTVLEREGFLFHYPVGDVVTTFVKRYITHARATTEALATEPARHLLVRYEDLLADPAAEVDRVCSWLGVGLPPEPEALTLLDGRHATALPENPSKPGVATPTEVEPEMARRFGYAAVTTDRERALVTACTSRWARRLGYDYADAAPSLAERAQLLRDWAKVEAWEREVLRRETGLRSFVRRRLVVLQAVVGHSPA